MRVAVLGGSSVATVQLASAVADWPGGAARRPPFELVLHGRDEGRLAPVADRSSDVLRGVAVVRYTTRLGDALTGADVVLVQIRVGGLAARRFDESFPWAAGLPGEETLGPGGLANALRTLRGLESFWRAMRSRCPDALVLILTNPAGIVREAAAGHGLRAVEVCDSPVALAAGLAGRVDRPEAVIAASYVGMNHVGWYVPTDETELEVLAADQAVAPEVVLAHGAVPLGYVRYYVDPDRIFESQQGRPTRAEQLMALEEIGRARLAAGDSPNADARPAPWYRLGVVAFLDAFANGAEQPMILGCANDGRLGFLRDDATVEGPVRFPAPGELIPDPLARLPPLPAALLHRHGVYERLALEAASAPDRAGLLRALLANPMVATARQAGLLADALLAADPELLGLTPATGGGG